MTISDNDGNTSVYTAAISPDAAFTVSLFVPRHRARGRYLRLPARGDYVLPCRGYFPGCTGKHMHGAKPFLYDTTRYGFP